MPFNDSCNSLGADLNLAVQFSPATRLVLVDASRWRGVVAMGLVVTWFLV
jgi:hypothetical protein